MTRFKVGKIIRTGIHQMQVKAGTETAHRHLEGSELTKALVLKLAEEAEELGDGLSAEDYVNELADLQQVLDDLMGHLGVTPEAVQTRKAEKFSKKGGFAEGLFVDHVDINPGEAYYDYHKNRPEKYPEIPEKE